MKLGQVIPYKISITPSDNNGFGVKVGCGRFVFESVESLVEALRDYLLDPKAMTERYDKAKGPQRECQAQAPLQSPSGRVEINMPSGAGRM